MARPSIQTAFNAGELSPALFGHVDFAKTSVGCSTLRNFYVSYKGGASSRAGTLFCGFSKQTALNFAQGTISFASNPSNGDTITLNGRVFTFVNDGSGTLSNYKINISVVNTGGTVGLLVSNLTGSATYLADPLLNVASYRYTSPGATAILFITYNSPGTVGNSYTLAASSATRSGATLTGGGDNPPRLIPFQFNLDQGLVLEFGELYMRVLSDGAYVTEATKNITAATKAAPCALTVTGHGLSTGDWVYTSGVVGMTQLNGRTFVISVVDANTITLQDVFGANVDSSAYTTYVSGGTVARLYTLVTPYHAADIAFLKYTQSADVVSLTLRNQITGTEYRPYDLARVSDTSWMLTALTTTSIIAAPTGLAGTATATTSTPTGYSYVCTAFDRDTGEESIASNVANVSNSVDISSTLGSIDLSWNPVTNASVYNIYKAPPAYGGAVPIGNLYGLAGSTYGTQFVDTNIVQDMAVVPPLHKNPFAAGEALSVTITNGASGLTGPIGFTISSTNGTGATGFGVIVGGVMVDWVFTSGGHDYAPGDTITFYDSGGVAATGNIDFTGKLPQTNGDTFTLNGAVFTWVTSGASSSNYQFNIGSGIGFVRLTLNTSTTYLADSRINVATYGDTGDVLNITYNHGGTGGNAYTLAASNATPSGATLTGGTGGTPTGTLNVGPTTGTYPSCVAYFQQRRVYGNTANDPDTFWMSQPGAYKNFDRRIPSLDTDSIEGTPWSIAVDGIQFMVPLLSNLIVLTGQAAYSVGGAGTSPTSPQPITPTSQQAIPQSFNGCHFHVPPVLIDYDLYYLQAKGAVIRSLSYNFWINVFTGVDVTYLSSHLFVGHQIDAMTWCQEPYKVMWAVRDDGVLLSLTSMKSQDVMGWGRHDTQGLFVGTCSITEAPAQDLASDVLYLVVERFFPNGKSGYTVERMDDRIWNSVEDAWCVDCALQTAQPTPNAILTVTLDLFQPVGYNDLVGGSGYSNQTTITIVDETGQGCTASPVITGGIITGIAFGGSTTVSYTNPIFVIEDPLGTGTGATATVVLQTTCTLSANAPVFPISALPAVVRAGGGVFPIISYGSDYVATACVTQMPVSGVIPNDPNNALLPFQPGDWTLTPTTLTVTGLWHLVGKQVTGLADGNVIPPQTVSATGTITLSAAASAITVGLAYTCQLQSLYLEGGTPTVQGRRKQVGAVTVRMEGSSSVDVGTNQPDASTQSPIPIAVTWANLATADTNVPGGAEVAFGNADISNLALYVRPVPLYTGDIRVTPTSGFQKQGQIAVQQSNPLPANIIALIPETDLGDAPDANPPRGSGG